MKRRQASVSWAAINNEVRPPRITALFMLMADLFAGQEVHSQRIQGLLTPAEWRRFRYRMHGPSVPVVPSRETLDRLYAYREKLRDADDLYRSANTRKRNKTMIGPDLFRQAEAAYDRAAETLGEILGDHPYIAHYLSPFPDFENPRWTCCATKEGMPRLLNAAAEGRPRIYSREKGDAYVQTAIEILRGIADREVESARRNISAATGQ
jgi:hypothetical protein